MCWSLLDMFLRDVRKEAPQVLSAVQSWCHGFNTLLLLSPTDVGLILQTSVMKQLLKCTLSGKDSGNAYQFLWKVLCVFKSLHSQLSERILCISLQKADQAVSPNLNCGFCRWCVRRHKVHLMNKKTPLLSCYSAVSADEALVLDRKSVV